MAIDYKSLFMLDPAITFLNHGSFGATPRAVFETQQEYQREMEGRPVEFLGRQATGLMAEARQALGDYVGSAAEDLVYFSNPTTAINMAARNLDLGEEDEILSTDHEYGAMDRTWRFVCGRVGARYVRQPIPLPVCCAEEVAEGFWSGVNERTKAVFVSQISSPTALTFPVEAICRRAREAGILAIVDGAHAVSQLPLDLRESGADIYTGACHKWLCAPKGAAFLYVRQELQPLMMPLVVSWGYEAEKPSGAQFIDYHEWQGTRDISAFLSVPAAIHFQDEHDWEAVRQRCHALASETRRRVNALTGLEAICPDSVEWFGQMAAMRLPEVEVEAFQARLYDEFQIEVPVYRWNGEPFMRVSFQAYNDEVDMERLLAALKEMLG